MSQFYQKHWARPKHSFKKGDKVFLDEFEGEVVVDWPHHAWIKVQYTTGPNSVSNPVIVFHEELTLIPN